jgi:hypothetical protein
VDVLPIIKNFLDQNNRLVSFPAKRKMKLHALYYLSTKFEPSKTYSEKEFNDILNQWHTFGDPATLRRELYNHKFIDRETNCRSYWLEEIQPDLAELEKNYG